MFRVVILDQGRLVYDAKAGCVSLPGEAGTCEVMDLHAPMITVLEAGWVVVDGHTLPIRKGIAKVERNELLVLVEQ